MKQVLVVDDNKSNMKLVKDLLEYSGFKVLSAVDGEEAFLILQKNTPDLILLDLQLPKMSGFDFFDKIQQDERFKLIKTVVLTAQATAEEREKIEGYGFYDQMYKPINTREFIKQINNYLG